MKLLWLVIAAVDVVLLLGGYYAVRSGLTTFGPVLKEFSSSFGMMIGGLVMIMTSVFLAGVLIHYAILRRRRQ